MKIHKKLSTRAKWSIAITALSLFAAACDQAANGPLADRDNGGVSTAESSDTEGTTSSSTEVTTAIGVEEDLTDTSSSSTTNGTTTATTENDSSGGTDANTDIGSTTSSLNASGAINSNDETTQTTSLGSSATPGSIQSSGSASLVYTNDFSDPNDRFRIDNFVHYRDPFVVNHTVGSSDHASTGGVNCGPPEETRPQTRDNPENHTYLCFPAANPDLGHMMAFAADSSGYGFVGGLPDQVFTGVKEVSVDINTTTAGSRNFVEIKVIPADQTFVNAMPCIPDLPCNDGWDYDDIGAVGAGSDSQEGTGLQIATPQRPDGYKFDRFNTFTNESGINYRSCDQNTSGFCFNAAVHQNNTGIRERFQHVFKDNGDGTLSFGINEGSDTHWVTAPGSFPEGPVRVVVAFHNYTGTKDGNGPGFGGNVSPSTGGFTWHWDNLNVYAEGSTSAEDFFGGTSADRIVTPNNCVAFSQGQRGTAHGTDIAPEFRCV